MSQGVTSGLPAEHYLAAARNAIRVIANQEAILLGRRGLACLEQVPPSADRDQRELSIHLIVGSALMATRGFGGEEIIETYKRAGDLCRSAGVGSQQLAAIRGLWAYHLVRAELESALELSAHIRDLSLVNHNPGAVAEAHLAFGFTLGHLGRAKESVEHLRAGLATPGVPPFRDRAMGFALDSGVALRGQLAKQLWYLGYPEESLREARETLAAAERLRSPYCIGWAAMFLAMIHEMRGEVDEDLRHSSEAIQMAIEHGLLEVHGCVSFITGGLSCTTASRKRAFRRCVITWSRRVRLDPELRCQTPSRRWGDCLLLTGNYDEALERVNEGLSIGAANGEVYCEAELHRLRGEILLAQGGHSPDLIEGDFRWAVDLARIRETRCHGGAKGRNQLQPLSSRSGP